MKPNPETAGPWVILYSMTQSPDEGKAREVLGYKM